MNCFRKKIIQILTCSTLCFGVIVANAQRAETASDEHHVSLLWSNSEQRQILNHLSIILDEGQSSGRRIIHVNSLALIAKNKILLPLGILLLDEDRFEEAIRHSAVNLISHIRDPDSIDYLISALSDSSITVANFAYTRLRHMIPVNLPYRAKGSIEERREDAKAWATWWNENKFDTDIFWEGAGIIDN